MTTDVRAGNDLDTRGPLVGRHRRRGRSMAVARQATALVAVAMAVLVLRAQVVEPFRIPAGSVSMSPTLEPGDRFLVDRTGDPRDVARGTVVVFDTPPGVRTTERVLVKRVIGMPGDVVELRDGQVEVNGSPIDEPYLAAGMLTFAPGEVAAAPGCHTSGDSLRCEVADGHVVVLGDNRSASLDSRAFGAVPMASILGVARVVVWPVGHAGGLAS